MKHPSLQSFLVAWVLGLALTTAAPAQAQPAADSLSMADPSTTFSARQLIIPAALITIGGFGVSNGWLEHVNHGVKNRMARLRSDHHMPADSYLRFLPAAANVALSATGLPARHSLRQRLLLTATATAAMAVMAEGAKRTVHERRPDNSDRRSFPSGHAATAFMGAELVRSDYGTGVGIAAYSVATLVAAMRLYNERHWLNDVLAGAGIGILSARMAYWLLPLEQRLLGWDDQSAAAAVVPTYEPQTQSLGFSVALAF